MKRQDEPPRSKERGWIVKALKALVSAGLLFVLAGVLLTGLADVFLASSQKWREDLRVEARVRSVMGAADRGGISLPDDLEPFLGIDFETVPGLGRLTKPVDHGELTVVAGGRRLAPGEALEPGKPRILVFGASQIFGLYNRADQTVAAHLERLAPEVAFLNYGVMGQTMDASAVHLETLLRQGVSADGVLVIGGAMEPLLHCVFNPATKASQDEKDLLRLKSVFMKLKQIVAPAPPVLPCAEFSDVAETVVDRTLSGMRAMIATARAHDLDITVVIPPQPWVGEADVSNIRETATFQLYSGGIGATGEMLLERLQKRPIPEVYDLTGVFQGGPPYFIDGAGHISDEGQRVLAKAIRDVLVTDGFLPGLLGRAEAARAGSP